MSASLKLWLSWVGLTVSSFISLTIFLREHRNILVFSVHQSLFEEGLSNEVIIVSGDRFK